MSETSNDNFQLPVLEISAEELAANKERAKEAESILTPKDDQVLVGLRSYCPVHGDITRASKVIKYTLYMKNEKGEIAPYQYSDVICLACLVDKWKKDVVANYPKNPDGTPGEIRMAPVFVTKLEYATHEVERLEANLKELEPQLEKDPENAELKAAIKQIKADLDIAQKAKAELEKQAVAAPKEEKAE